MEGGVFSPRDQFGNSVGVEPVPSDRFGQARQQGPNGGATCGISQILAVPSNEAVLAHRPSRLNAAETTHSLWRKGSASFKPVAASHTWAVPSMDAVMTRNPSALNRAQTSS